MTGRENGRHQREADFIRAHRKRLREVFTQPEISRRALQWKVKDEVYEHIVDEVTRMGPRDIEHALRRYAAARVSQKDGALELKRQLLLNIQMYANGDIELD